MSSSYAGRETTPTRPVHSSILTLPLRMLARLCAGLLMSMRRPVLLSSVSTRLPT